MNGFTYTLTLLEPVLANSLGGEPNSANSLFYIPGGLIRGAAINAYTGVKDAGNKDFHRLFLDGSVRFLNAYPLSENGRALPTPLKYKAPKYFSGSAFSTIKDEQIHAIEETWQINVHTQRDAEAGHAKTTAGAVYRYISLPAGLILEGAVLVDDDTDFPTIKALLKETKTILLGKARTAGYGAARLAVKDGLTLNEFNRDLKGQLSKFTLVLLSPAIVRDENGQSSLDISPVLKVRLGVEVNITNVYQRAEVVGGFNRTWGLPLPQVTAIAAGSVFEVTAEVDAEKLITLQETGIGERRAEGFGRVTVNPYLPNIEKDEQWHSVAARMDEPATSTDLAKNKTAELMVKRLVCKDLDEKVIHIARQMTEKYPPGKIPNSQLSRWRVVIRAAIDKKNIADLKKFLSESKGKTGWKKMEKAKIEISEDDPQRLTVWMEEWLEKPEKLKDALKSQSIERFKLGDNTFELDGEANLEYRLRLLDTVLAVMAKKNGGKND